MRILISNDDGVDAPGIRILAAGLRDAGHEVLVVAPDRDRSGASNSLTLDMPIRVVRQDERTWRVHGTPERCNSVETLTCGIACVTAKTSAFCP